MSPRLFFFLLTAAALAGTGCRRPSPTPGVESGLAVPVQQSVAALESLPVLLESPATVRPAARASLAAKLTGSVATFPLGLGAPVSAGDVLVTLHAPETAARVHQAQAQVDEATRNTDRARLLVEKGVNAPDSLRAAEDRLRYMQAALAEADALLSYTIVRAPFAGVITEKHVLPGDLATPGLPLLVLESTQHLRAEGAVPEKVATTLHPGNTIAVLLDDAPEPVTGQIEEISSAADTVSRSVMVKVALPAGTARSGQFARLQVPAGRTDALFVPATAVTRFGQMERIFTVQDARAVLRLVKTGRTAGERVEIVAGLRPGERFVVNPPAALRDGQALVSRP